MEKSGTACFGIARLLAIAASLLFAAFAASASGYAAHTTSQSDYRIGHDHHVVVVSDTLERHGSPAEQPLHCHLQSSHSLQIGPSQASTESNHPQLTAIEISPPTRETTVRVPSIWARVPIPVAPRFILFGNFRS